MGNVGIFCLGVAIGVIIFYLCFYKKFTQVKKINEDLTHQEIDLKISIAQLSEQHKIVREQIKQGLEQYKTVQEQIEDIKANVQNFYNTNFDLAKERLSKAKEQLDIDYAKTCEEYNKEYLQVLEECGRGLHEHIKELTDRLAAISTELQEKKELVDAATAAAIREQEAADNVNFYKLNLSEEDLQEIKKLKEILPYLRNKEALCKVIWKIYYEKPYTDLIGRVVGSNIRCGIYKITNLQNNMCYVGQSVDIANRWKQHIKRGIGAETAPRNKLYPVMQQIGPENFRFEIIEDCSRELLNQREDYWQDYFNAINFGYSIR